MTVPGFGTRKTSRAWIIIPAAIVVAAAIGLVVSSFQKEAGLASPADSGRAAAAALADLHRALESGDDAQAYAGFSAALLVAKTAQKNMAIGNPADTRLYHPLTSALDCYSTVREAWQATLDHAWDPEVQGRPEYWRASHPALKVSASGPLTFAEVRRLYSDQAHVFLERAVDLAE